MDSTASIGEPPPARTVSRRSGLTHAEFVSEHLVRHRPVVLVGAVRAWKAVERWTPHFFAERFGDRVVVCEKREIRVRELMERVIAAADGDPAPYLIAASYGRHLVDLFPELLLDISPEPEYLRPNWLGEWCWVPQFRREFARGPLAELYVGGRGSGFPRIHWDRNKVHAFSGQIHGTKHWYLFPPGQDDCLYPRTENRNQSQVDDVQHPDAERFPRFLDAVRYETTLEPGDLLFVPGGWWHVTRTPESSISVSLNSANASNAASMRGEVVGRIRSRHPRLAPLANAYLWVGERLRAWRDRRVVPTSPLRDS